MFKDKSDYKCTLSPELLEKAKKELNEDPKTRHLEVTNLRKRLEKVPGLQPRTDTQFLLRFLRARKFDQERAFQMVKNYYDARMQNHEIFEDLKPSRVKLAFDSGLFEVLDQRDNQGCAIVIIRLGIWNPDQYSLITLARAMFLIFLKLLNDEETQINGIHVINNSSALTMKHASHMTPSTCKMVLQILQDVLPLRLKRYDFVNEPSFSDFVWAIMRPFMKDKLSNRASVQSVLLYGAEMWRRPRRYNNDSFINRCLSRTMSIKWQDMVFLNGDKIDKLYTTVNREILPTDFGGPLPPYKNKAWMDALLASDAHFEEDNKFGFVRMNVSGGTSDSKSGDADMKGLGGTFRKLEV